LFFVKEFSGGGAKKKNNTSPMQSFCVKCHPPGAAAPPASFFILSKGRNTGRPSYTPNPNCFVLTCHPDEVTTYYWIVYALWETRAFREYLNGSVIDFIHIRHLKKVIEAGRLNADNIMKVVTQLQQLKELELNLRKQLELIKYARKAILRAA
jgi:hypothetical protein